MAAGSAAERALRLPDERTGEVMSEGVIKLFVSSPSREKASFSLEILASDLAMAAVFRIETVFGAAFSTPETAIIAALPVALYVAKAAKLPSSLAIASSMKTALRSSSQRALPSNHGDFAYASVASNDRRQVRLAFDVSGMSA